jgi:hypothetical protein
MFKRILSRISQSPDRLLATSYPSINNVTTHERILMTLCVWTSLKCISNQIVTAVAVEMPFNIHILTRLIDSRIMAIKYRSRPTFLGIDNNFVLSLFLIIISTTVLCFNYRIAVSAKCDVLLTVVYDIQTTKWGSRCIANLVLNRACTHTLHLRTSGSL